MGCVTEILIVGLLCMLAQCKTCDQGYIKKNRECFDIDECDEGLCGNNTDCKNTKGSYSCTCKDGFNHTKGLLNFTADDAGQCIDKNECWANPHICGDFGNCVNQIGGFSCVCHIGYTNTSIHGNCTDIDECQDAEAKEHDLCGFEARCENRQGSYWCRCPMGYTNYGNSRTKCSELSCDQFNGDGKPTPSLEGLAEILLMMKSSCLALSNPSGGGSGGNTDGVTLLEKLLTATEHILSPGHLDSSDSVSGLLATVEDAIALIGPQLKDDVTTMNTTETDVVIAVQRGEAPPTGPVRLTNENATLDTDWTTAAGTGSYSGFALAALVSYKDLEKSVNRSFDDITGYEVDGVTPGFKVFSKVVSVVVSNLDTQNLSSPVHISLRRLQASEDKKTYVCAHWTESGSWSTHGCYMKESNVTHTVCSCDHLSSFGVLMALYPMKHTFALQVLTQIGLSISLLCLVICILTFKFCRSIQGTRTTIHLHLCICLFMADLVFLAGISKTKPVGGCRFVAALLHYFFLGLFTWMLLEGVQLYRMVVLVFNATIRPLYLLAFGYGAPLAIVIISAIIRPTGYGTDEYCWLSLKDGLIWSFFGPVCLIIIFNVVFFIVTVWKLAQKFTSLNPDLSKLHKIKAFTVTAIAQMCILGLMWVFGAFLFQEGSTAVAYIFTILNSLQGALVFIMHCLLSKQVRDEYAHFLSCLCPQEKKKYSDFSSTNPSSSQSQASRSGQHTGESQI